jgi:hypothetical protein
MKQGMQDQISRLAKFPNSGMRLECELQRPLVPKFHLGTPPDPAKFYFAQRSAIKLPQQVRSQLKLGKEVNARAVHKKLRHPKRSEAANFVFAMRQHPSVVEGPGYFCRLMRVTRVTLIVSFANAVSRVRCFLIGSSARPLQPGSFDCGSVTPLARHYFSFAFAQDDGLRGERFAV